MCVCLQKGDVDSDAGGEDDDFGDEIRSDDEEEVGNDDANEGGGTLHQVRAIILKYSCITVFRIS